MDRVTQEGSQKEANHIDGKHAKHRKYCTRNKKNSWLKSPGKEEEIISLPPYIVDIGCGIDAVALPRRG